MSKEAMKLALEALEMSHELDDTGYADAKKYGLASDEDITAKLCTAITALREALAEQPAQQEPVAYDKTEINCFAQDLYDQKMREGKRGHYESMFHVIHQCIKKVSPTAQRTWVGLTDEEVDEWTPEIHSVIRAIEAKLKEKNSIKENT